MSAPFATPTSRQLFSIPYNFILYMIENPASHDGLQNLYQTCKYFWNKNPILFPSDLCCRNTWFFYGTEKLHFKPNIKFWPGIKLTVFSKIIITRFYRFSPKYLTLVNIVLSVGDFDLLVAVNTVETFDMKYAEIVDKTIDSILEKLPKINRFSYYNPKELYSNETFQNLVSLQRNTKLDRFELHISRISGAFSPSFFPSFLIQHCSFVAYFALEFAPNLSREAHELAEAVKNFKGNDNQNEFYYVLLNRNKVCGNMKFKS